MWTCATYQKKGKDGCPSKRIDEEILLATIEELQKTTNFDKTKIKAIIINNDMSLCILNKDGTEVRGTWSIHSRSDSWTPEMKAKAKERELERMRQLWQK